MLFAIGFKGGQELAHTDFSPEILWGILFGILISIVIPIYTFFILKTKLNIENSGAVAAAYGSVSAVTFVTAISFLELQDIVFNGHMVAIMALMEAPAIIVAVILIRYFSKDNSSSAISLGSIAKHSFTNGSVLLIIGSLVIGFFTSDQQAIGIKPFTNDLFKGFLSIFLLDMGISCGKKLKDFVKSGWFTIAFALLVPLINGVLVAYITSFFMDCDGDRLLLSILAASASYIAVPAAMQITVPKANPGIYIPMALGVTFPFNITIGMPIYFAIINMT